VASTSLAMPTASSLASSWLMRGWLRLSLHVWPSMLAEILQKVVSLMGLCHLLDMVPFIDVGWCCFGYSYNGSAISRIRMCYTGYINFIHQFFSIQ